MFLCGFEAVSGPLGPWLGCGACGEVYGEVHAYLQLLGACYHAWEFGAVFELDYADGVGCHVLELLGGDVDDGVCEEFAFWCDFDPCEFL